MEEEGWVVDGCEEVRVLAIEGVVSSRICSIRQQVKREGDEDGSNGGIMVVEGSVDSRRPKKPLSWGRPLNSFWNVSTVFDASPIVRLSKFGVVKNLLAT
jgi:hypothetical protein